MASDDFFKNLNFNPEKLNNNTQEKTNQIQNQMAEVQKMLAAVTVEGVAGLDSYSVKVTINGRHEAEKVVIEPKLMSERPEVVCDLVASAITDASHKLEMAIQTKMMEMFKKFNPA
jgi:nucleoid-associated protein EbfC